MDLIYCIDCIFEESASVRGDIVEAILGVTRPYPQGTQAGDNQDRRNGGQLRCCVTKVCYCNSPPVITSKVCYGYFGRLNGGNTDFMYLSIY